MIENILGRYAHIKLDGRAHRIYFEEADTIFEDDNLQVSQDDGSYDEERFWAIGRIRCPDKYERKRLGRL